MSSTFETILERLAHYINNQETHTTLETALNEAVEKDKLAEDSNADACLLVLLKLARNMVANTFMDQCLAYEGATLVAIEHILRNRSLLHLGLPIIRMGVQTISNIVTANTNARAIVWKEWMFQEKRSEVFCELLTMNDDVVVMSTMVLILNSIKNAPGRCQMMVASEAGLKIVGIILDDLEHLHNDESSENFELGYSILGQLIDCAHFGDLYTSMGAVGASDGEMNARRVILLKVLDSKVHNEKEDRDIPRYIKEAERNLLSGLVRDLSKQAIQAIEQATREDGTIMMDNVTDVYTALDLVLQLTSTLVTREILGPFRECMVELDVMGAVIELLRCCETMEKPGFHYLKRDIVRLMGALCYNDRRMQDRVREAGGIPLILAQCKIDDANPYIREHAVLAIRNLLDDNRENQALISEMEPIQAVQTDDLSRMGLTARLENGKVKLSKSKK
ncbi:spinocerebellar ataxia type 10 protein domain-containing protein [Dichotomocladium elegans]|nr:spinocerebellar ataxia type 10 protein domain-containing protein [Dichotomocladium elegans]